MVKPPPHAVITQHFPYLLLNHSSLCVAGIFIQTLPMPADKLIKKENKIFLIYQEIRLGAVAKSYMRKGFLILYMRKCANI
jgi:hypothetical protein